MSPGDWIQLIGVVIILIGAIGGGVWWFAYRDAQGQAAIKSQEELKSAMGKLTDATNQMTMAMGSLEAKLADHEKRVERVEREQVASWKKLDMIIEHLFKDKDGDAG